MSADRKATLTKPQRELLEQMHQLNFGKLLDVRFRDGQPVTEPLPKVKCRMKLGGKNGPHRLLNVTDFVLKDKVIELFAYMQRKRDGIIPVLTVQDGLPTDMELDELP